MKLTKIKKVPAELQALHSVREAIISGSIPQGSRITEGELSEQMGVSRATVRSALQQLATEGLTTLKRYAGWSVITLSATDVWELYTLRSALERLAARLVASKIDNARKARIEKVLSSLIHSCQDHDWMKIAEADFQFHRHLVGMADNERLSIQYSLLEPQIRMYIRSLDALIADTDTVIRQHTEIAKVIISGNAEEAGRMAESHNLVDGDAFFTHLSSREGIKNVAPV